MEISEQSTKNFNQVTDQINFFKWRQHSLQEDTKIIGSYWNLNRSLQWKIHQLPENNDSYFIGEIQRKS